ncbi:MAG: Hsp33 family molecular chaperone HslO [Bacillota bacterium]|nr:Hsp33 family molecular chaperone HslO [Bacillota bacterium]
MNNYIVRGTAANGTVRGYAAVTTELVRDAKKVHGLSPVASAALGRTLTAAALMSRMLDGASDTITIQIKGDGPLGSIVAISDSSANVRGYVNNPDVDLPLNTEGKLDVGKGVGAGYLNIIRDLGLKEPYVGYVDLLTGEIADDIAYYYAYSEQIPSVVALGVLVDKDGSIINAGGFVVQLMPGADEEIVDHLERRSMEIPMVTELLSQGKTPEDMLEFLLGEKGLHIADTSPCRFQCNCSRERMERNILSLGRKEIQEIIDEQGEAEVQCHFCNTKYLFSKKDLTDLLEIQK